MLLNTKQQENIGKNNHMSLNFLDFEQPIAELDAKIEELELVNHGQDLDLDLEDQITQLRGKKCGINQENIC